MYIEFTPITASNTAISDNVRNYITHRIFNTDLFLCSFYSQIGEKVCPNDGF